MSRRGRMMVEHDGITYDLRWETRETADGIAVKYTVNDKEANGDSVSVVPHGNAGIVTWLNDMIMCDMVDHMKELENADTATEGFPEVEPISARAKPENDAN